MAASFPDPPRGVARAAGPVNDAERAGYLGAHFEAAAQAIRHGVDLRGYYVWSLLDNSAARCGAGAGCRQRGCAPSSCPGSGSSETIMKLATNAANRGRDQPRLRTSRSYISTELQTHRTSVASAKVTPLRR